MIKRVQNGMIAERENYGAYTNAHIQYKGRSIVIDYEFHLHPYSDAETRVPFEMYPYGSDIFVGSAPLDEKFHKADICNIIAQVEKALENEPEGDPWADWNEEENYEDYDFLTLFTSQFKS